jgi:hypothetical protein
MFVCCCENWRLALQCQESFQKMIDQERSLRALPPVLITLMQWSRAFHAATNQWSLFIKSPTLFKLGLPKVPLRNLTELTDFVHK